MHYLQIPSTLTGVCFEASLKSRARNLQILDVCSLDIPCTYHVYHLSSTVNKLGALPAAVCCLLRRRCCRPCRRCRGYGLPLRRGLMDVALLPPRYRHPHLPGFHPQFGPGISHSMLI